MERGARMTGYEYDEQGYYIPKPPPPPPPRLADMILNTNQLAAIPQPRPLIPGFLFRDSLTWVGGAPGAYKSFLAVELACHVATGTTWRGHKVSPGRVLYIVAEGKSGIWKRVRAWQKAAGIDAQIDWLPIAPQVGTDMWEQLIAHTKDQGYDLILVDTQSRVTVGLDENQAEGSSKVVSHLTRLKDASGACVIIVHHLNRGGTNLRGSTVVDGAADTIIELVKVDGVSRVRNRKQKDVDEAGDYYVRSVAIEDSMILVEVDKPTSFDKRLKEIRLGN